MRPMPVLLLFALALVGLSLPVAAQDDPPLGDPDCEQDPTQMGCDPECADPTVDCGHPPCPTGLAGQALPNGENFMTWTMNSRSDVRVYRAEGDGPFVETDYHEFPQTRHLDQEAAPGVTYRYMVTAVGLDQEVNNPSQPAEGESPGCEVIEITTIPVFPQLWTGAFVMAAGLVGYAVVRRRRA